MLKVCGQSETTDRPDGRAGGQLVRRPGSRAPAGKRGAARLPRHEQRGLVSDQKKNTERNPEPLPRGVGSGAPQTTSRHDEPNLENATRERT